MKNSTLKAATIALFSGLFIMGCEDNSAEDAGERIDEAITELRDKGIKVHDKLKMHVPGFKNKGFEGWYETMIHPKSAFGVIIELIEFTKAPPDTEW